MLGKFHVCSGLGQRGDIYRSFNPSSCRTTYSLYQATRWHIVFMCAYFSSKNEIFIHFIHKNEGYLLPHLLAVGDMKIIDRLALNSVTVLYQFFSFSVLIILCINWKLMDYIWYNYYRLIICNILNFNISQHIAGTI